MGAERVISVTVPTTVVRKSFCIPSWAFAVGNFAPFNEWGGRGFNRSANCSMAYHLKALTNSCYHFADLLMRTSSTDRLDRCLT